jgi:hypothetical protein
VGAGIGGASNDQRVQSLSVLIQSTVLSVDTGTTGGAAAGIAIVSLRLARWSWHYAMLKQRRGWAMLAYWVTAAGVGNLLSSVALRDSTDDRAAS